MFMVAVMLLLWLRELEQQRYYNPFILCLVTLFLVLVGWSVVIIPTLSPAL